MRGRYLQAGLLCAKSLAMWNYDLVVVGGGSGGYAAASRGAELGLKVAVVDGADELGGLCSLRGCMPSKTLIETANRMRAIRNAGDFAIKVPAGCEVDMKALQKRRSELVAEFQEDRVSQLEDERFDLIRGTARFKDDETLLVTLREDGREVVLSFKAAVLATGSIPNVPTIEGLAEAPFFLSDDLLEVDALPQHLLVLGGGVIGCEMAHCFEGLGSEVTLLHSRGSLLGKMPEGVSEAVTEASRRRGMTIHFNAETTRVTQTEEGIELTVTVDGVAQQVSGSHLLVAIGRRPNIDSLALEEAGIEFSQKGIEVNDFCATNKKHIFAVGDCAEGVQVVHKAVLEGKAAGENAAIEIEGGQAKPVDSNPLILAVFTEPEVIQIGPTPEELSRKSDDYTTLSYPLNDMGKGIIKRIEEGFVAFSKEALTDRLVSATAVGPGVIDFSHSMAVAIRRGLTQEQFYNVPHYHPTMAEAWTYPEASVEE